MHKNTFAATYPGLWQREGRAQSTLEPYEESLGLVALGRELEVQQPGSL